ncbi:hypothetical protein Q4100_04755 [Acinetobacter baumannii]
MVDRDNELDKTKPQDQVFDRGFQGEPLTDFTPPFNDNDFPFPSSLDRNEDDAAINAIPPDETQFFNEPPAHVLQDQKEALNSYANQNPSNQFHAFLVEKFRDLTVIARGRNPDAIEIDHSSSFKKNEQTQWFKEYNELQSQKTEDKDVIFCKPNGFFYTEAESKDLVTALEKLGLSEDEAKKASNSFEFAFIGNTESRKSPKNTFQAYVIKSKDPKTPEILKDAELLTNRKEELVRNYLSKNANLDEALEKYNGLRDQIIQSDFKKNGGKPFISSNDIDFLNPYNLKNLLDEIPEIKGKYRIVKLDSDDNDIKFSGYSSGLSSYFTDRLSLHKVIATDEKTLKQSDLENFIHEKFKDQPKDILLNEAPANQDSIINRQQDKVKQGVDNSKPTSKTPNPSIDKEPFEKVKSVPSFPKDSFPKDSPREESYRNKKSQDNQEEEKLTLGEVIAETARQLSKEALRVLIELALMILKLILALLKATASLALGVVNRDLGAKYSQIKNDFMNDANISKNFENIIKNSYLRGNKNDIGASKNEKSNELKVEQDEALKNRIESKQLEDEKLSLKKTVSYSPVNSAKAAINELTDDKKEEIIQKALDALKNNSVESNLNYKDLIKIPALHGFIGGKSELLPNQFVDDDKFGILLNKYDEVVMPDGRKGGVLAAFSANDELNYAVVSNDPDGNYTVDFLKAEDVSLSKLNAYNFDNEDYLSEKLSENLKNNFEKLDVSQIEFLDLHDYQNSPKNLTNIDDYLQKNDLIDYSKIKDFQTKNVNEILEENDPDFAIRNLSQRQLHSVENPSLLTSNGFGSVHPLFGLTLDVNDKVSATLKESGVGVEGAVLGAFNDKGNLKYLIEANNNKYLIDAKDTMLIAHNSGGLDYSQIDNILRYPKNLAKEIKSELPIVPLGHKEFEKLNTQNNINHLANPNLDTTSRNVSISTKYSGVLQELPNEEKRLLEDLNTKKTYLVLGEINGDNRKKIAIEVERNWLSKDYKPVDESKNGFYSLDLDSASIRDIQGKLNTTNLEKFTQTYNLSLSGADNNTANKLKQLYAKDSEKLGEELLFTQIMVKELLKNNSYTAVSNDSKFDLGVNADLSKINFNNDGLFKRMSNHLALEALGKDGKLIAHIPKAFDIEQAKINKVFNLDNLLRLAQESSLTSNKLIPVDEARVVKLPLLEAANDYNKPVNMGRVYNLSEYSNKTPSITATEIVISSPDQPKVESLSDSKTLNTSFGDNFKFNTDTRDYHVIKSLMELKDGVVSDAAQSYVSDIIGNGNSIDEKFSKLKMDINDVLPHLGGIFNSQNGNVSFSELNENVFESFNKSIVSNEIGIKVANIKSSYEDISVSQKINIEKTSKRIEDIREKFSIESISPDNVTGFNILVNDIKFDVQKKVNEYLDVGKVVYTLDFISKDGTELKLNQLNEFVAQKIPLQQLNSTKDLLIQNLDKDKKQSFKHDASSNFDLDK